MQRPLRIPDLPQAAIAGHFDLLRDRIEKDVDSGAVRPLRKEHLASAGQGQKSDSDEIALALERQLGPCQLGEKLDEGDGD